MNIALFERGRVGAACRTIIQELGITILDPDEYHTADFWISVHWPTIFRRDQLSIPKEGILNLHNSILPWNRGAHATTWAIIDQTPIGATFHWIDEGVDTGDIFGQEFLEKISFETADELYQRTAAAEVRLFRSCMLRLMNGDRTRIKQPKGGSVHKKADFDRLICAMTTSDSFVVRK